MSRANNSSGPGKPPVTGLVKRYLVYSRSPFLSASIIPALFGTALAWRLDRVFDPVLFVLVLVGLTAAHAGVNLANDYFDFKLGVDTDNPFRSTFSGGSPFLAEGTELPSRFMRYIIFSFALAGGCGLALIVMVDRGIGPVFWLMLAGFIGGFFYSAPPLKFSHRGLGDIMILFCFGPLPILGAYYVQTNTLAWLPALAFIPPAIYITNVLWINQFPDADSDARAGKRTMVVRLGTSTSRYVYYVLNAAAYLAIVLLSLSDRIGPWFLAGLLTLPVAVRASVILHRNYTQPGKLIPAQADTVIIQLATGLILTLAIAFS